MAIVDLPSDDDGTETLLDDVGGDDEDDLPEIDVAAINAADDEPAPTPKRAPRRAAAPSRELSPSGDYTLNWSMRFGETNLRPGSRVKIVDRKDARRLLDEGAIHS